MTLSDLLLEFTQFGAAGLIGVLWILERRHAAHRDRQLDEAHERLVRERREAAVLVQVVKENTRAITSLEHAQRRLIGLLARRERPLARDAG